MPCPARCWEHAVLAACGPGSLLALFQPPLILPCFPFPSLVFLALLGVQGSLQPPSICGIPGHRWCPPASFAAGTQQGQHLVKLPSVFFTTFPSQPVWPWLAEPVPPSPSLPGDGRSLGEPHAPPEQANPVLWLFVSQQRWHAAGAVPGGSAARTILYAVGCQKREPSTGFTAAKQGMGLPRGPLPHAQQPQPKAEGGKLPVK